MHQLHSLCYHPAGLLELSDLIFTNKIHITHFPPKMPISENDHFLKNLHKQKVPQGSPLTYLQISKIHPCPILDPSCWKIWFCVFIPWKWQSPKINFCLAFYQKWRLKKAKKDYPRSSPRAHKWYKTQPTPHSKAMKISIVIALMICIEKLLRVTRSTECHLLLTFWHLLAHCCIFSAGLRCHLQVSEKVWDNRNSCICF